MMNHFQLICRVARKYKRGELLTKSWLMGVRRGWLSLLKPSISNWDDVFKAFDRLLTFVDNLKEQVEFVRRDPLSIGTDQLDKAFKKLRSTLEDQKGSAVHWMQVDLDPEGYGRGTFTKDQGQHMFNLYKTNFEVALETHVKSRGTVKNPYQRHRLTNTTELLDNVLEILRKGAKRLEEAIDVEKKSLGYSPTEEEWKEPVFKEFSFGDMKIVVVDPKAKGGLIKDYVKELEKAYELSSRKGFKKLWYGVLFVESTSIKQLDPQEMAQWKASGYYDLRSIAGLFKSGKDVVTITNPPRGFSGVLIHELGHRYWFKFMTSSQRARFADLVKVKKPGKPGVVIPSKLELKLVKDSEDDIYAKHLIVDHAIKAFRNDTSLFSNAIQKAERTLPIAIGNFIFSVEQAKAKLSVEVPHIFSDPEIKRQWQHVQNCLEALVIEDDLKNMLKKIQSLPLEIRSKAFDSERDDWVALMMGKLMEAEGNAYQLVEDVHRKNKQEIEVAEKEAAPYMDPSDPRIVSPVSEYGQTNIEEAFAEAFAHYVMEKQMDRAQIESFRYIVLNKTAMAERMKCS